LQYGDKNEILKKQKENLDKRKEKQPLDFGSAGSTFKKYDGISAGQLIDECGLKGFFVGGAEVSTKHAGFVINRGNATYNDVLELIKQVQKIVYDKKQVNLETEIQLIGDNI